MILEFPKKRKSPTLTPAQILRLSRAASRSDHVLCKLVEVSTFVGVSAKQLTAVRVEHVNQMDGTIMVANAVGENVEVVLGFDGSLVVHNAMGGRKRGLLFTDHHGEALEPDADAEAFASELLNRIDGGIDFDWSWRSIQDGILSAMLDFDVDYAVVEAQAGLRALGRGRRFERILSQRVAADWWSGHMGIGLLSPFVSVKTMKIAAACEGKKRPPSSRDDDRGAAA